MTAPSIFLIVLAGVFTMYVCVFFMCEWKDLANDKKQFIKQWLIPFYWWGYFIKEGIKNAIKQYEKLD